jgi:hypothetical protein
VNQCYGECIDRGKAPESSNISRLIMNIFISWYDGYKDKFAKRLFDTLIDSGHTINTSPNSPESGKNDKRWDNWFKEGLPKSIQIADEFIAIITPNCDGSTWMQIEYQEALNSNLKDNKPKLFFLRLDSPEKPIKYQQYYLDNSIQLPNDVNRILKILKINE